MRKAHLRIDEARNEVFFNGKKTHLTAKEYRLLLALKKSNRTLSRIQLLEHVNDGDEGFDKDERTIDKIVSHLRRKIGYGPISTVHTFGYRYDG